MFFNCLWKMSHFSASLHVRELEARWRIVGGRSNAREKVQQLVKELLPAASLTNIRRRVITGRAM